MTQTAVGTAGLVTVVRLDLRAAGTGPGDLDPSAVGPDTLLARQEDAVHGRLPGPPAADGRRRLVDVGRVLVLDDTAAFASHAAAYEHLLLAPTIARLLCVLTGAPAAPDAIDLPPRVAASTNAGVLWASYPRGVGWNPEKTTTTRLAEAGTDPDGTATLGDLAETLADPEVYDRVFAAITEMDGNVAAPAVRPLLRWPALDERRPDEEQGAGNDPFTAAEAVAVPAEAASDGPREQASGPGQASVDIASLLIGLWSYGPLVARCERLLAEAEREVRRLPRLPGAGGRRAWRAVTALGEACAELDSVGAPDGPARSALRGAAGQLRGVGRPLSLWHPAAVLVPALMLATGAGVGADAGIAGSGTPTAGAVAASAAVAAAVLAATAFAWWRRATRRWIARVPLGPALADVARGLGALPAEYAGHGVALLSRAAERWHGEQRRALVSWWSAAWRGRRARLLGEVAELIRDARVAVPGVPAVPAVPVEDAEQHPAVAAAGPPAARLPATIADMARLLAAGPDDQDFLQLTGPGELPLLDGAPQGARLVGFAPAAARQALAEALGERTPATEIAWLPAGETVGILRLVPLRRGVIRAAGGPVPAAETVLAITVTGDRDGASALASWLAGNDQLAGRVVPPEGDGAPVVVRLLSPASAEGAIRDILDCLQAADERATVGIIRQDRPGLTAGVTAAQARTARTGPQADALAKSILRTLGLV